MVRMLPYVDRSWANNDPMLAPLRCAKEQLSESMNPFARLVMSHDASDLQKVIDKCDIVGKCSKFSLDLDPIVSRLQAECKQLCAMHASRAGCNSGSRPAKRKRQSAS